VKEIYITVPVFSSKIDNCHYDVLMTIEGKEREVFLMVFIVIGKSF
jgi:hypothetical protein